MRLHRKTWLAVALASVVAALLNLHAWRPGIGGRSDRADGVQPQGSELELYYGWPACFRAELLRSDDPGMGERALRAAPFYLPPYAGGWVSSRCVSWGAVVLDAAVAVLGVGLVAVVSECGQRGRWPRRAVVAVLVIGLLLAAGYLTAGKVGATL